MDPSGRRRYEELRERLEHVERLTAGLVHIAGRLTSYVHLLIDTLRRHGVDVPKLPPEPPENGDRT